MNSVLLPSLVRDEPTWNFDMNKENEAHDDIVKVMRKFEAGKEWGMIGRTTAVKTDTLIWAIGHLAKLDEISESTDLLLKYDEIKGKTVKELNVLVNSV